MKRGRSPHPGRKYVIVKVVDNTTTGKKQEWTQCTFCLKFMR